MRGHKNAACSKWPTRALCSWTKSARPAVGGLRDLKVDIRIVAATNKDIGEALKVGVFRQDRYSAVGALLRPTLQRQVQTADRGCFARIGEPSPGPPPARQCARTAQCH